MISLAALQVVARPPAPSSIPIPIFFFRVICTDHISGIGSRSIRRSVKTLRMLSMRNTKLVLMQDIRIAGFPKQIGMIN